MKTFITRRPGSAPLWLAALLALASLGLLAACQTQPLQPSTATTPLPEPGEVSPRRPH